MEVSLYDSNAGYYGAGTAAIGRRGDFYTSVSVGNCFGELLALQAEEVWEKLGRPPDFLIVEQGGHDTRLGGDVLDAIEKRSPAFAGCVRYTVCDVLPASRARPDARIHRYDRLEDIEAGKAGLFLCNELLDAFPAHRIRFRSGGWHELWVVLEGDKFTIVERPVTSDVAVAIRERIPVGSSFPDGYTTEICLEISSWIEAAAAILGTGMLLVIDYGFFAPDYYATGRADGTLRCYHGHRAGDDPLAGPGEHDLTAHVDWTCVRRAGEAAGLNYLGCSDQGAFLTRLATPLLMAWERGQCPERNDRKWMRQFQTLTHPGMMGRVFGVMGFSRGGEGGEWAGFSAADSRRGDL